MVFLGEMVQFPTNRTLKNTVAFLKVATRDIGEGELVVEERPRLGGEITWFPVEF